jgi:hypothetical protein
VKLYRNLVAAGLLSQRIAPLCYSRKNGVVVANWLAATASDRLPLRRDNDWGLHMPVRPNDKGDLGFARKLVV